MAIPLCWLWTVYHYDVQQTRIARNVQWCCSQMRPTPYVTQESTVIVDNGLGDIAIAARSGGQAPEAVDEPYVACGAGGSIV